MYDALVVGAGPAGSRVALNLARLGHRMAVLEKHRSLEEAVRCTGIISEACFDQAQVGEDVVLGRASGARFFSPSGACLPLENPNVCILIVDQKAMELQMVHQAEQAGAEVHFSWSATDVQVTARGVTVTVAQNGKRQLLEARSLVLASGFRCRLPQRLGLGINGDFAIGAQVELENLGVDGIEVYTGQRFAPGFFGWAVPTYPGQAMVGVLCRDNPRPHLEALLQHLQEQGRVSRTTPQFTFGAIPLAPAKRTVAARVLVLGDAAGQVKPTTGGGIRYALLGADLAAPILSRALEDENPSAEALSGYDQSWREHLAAELRVARLARRLYEGLDDRRLETAFSILLRSRRLASNLTTAFQGHFDWHSPMVLYTLSKLQPWWTALGWTRSLVHLLAEPLSSRDPKGEGSDAELLSA